MKLHRIRRGAQATLSGIVLSAVLFSTAHAALITSDLYVGVASDDVVTLQQYLKTDSSIYPEGIVSGYFGPRTKAAVIRFQNRYDLPPVGRVGPLTRAKINMLLGSGGGGGPIGDVFAPMMSPETVATTSTSATVSWSTSEPARSRVMYGTSYPFLYATAPSAVSSSVDTQANITLAGLAPNTLYYYVRESVDLSENIMWTVAKTFVTRP